MIGAINKFLTELRDTIKALSDEDFKTQVEAVNTSVSEKDINIKKENERFWGEISVHKYQFTRQQVEMDELKTLTKQELLDHFEKVFFSKDTKRVDLALTSEHHTEVNAENREENAKTEMYTNQLERVFHDDMNTFKESASFHDDMVKINWESAKH